MTLASELFWENLERVYRSSISYQFARYALRLNYEALPPEVIHQAKRSLLDTLGCGVGGYMAPGRPMCESVAKELGGPEEATIFGSGLRASAFNATLVNGFIVRFTEYNDTAIVGGHLSETVPGILAVAERQKAGGRDFLTAMVIAYELGGRGTGGSTGLSMPPALGKLMGLNEDQIANAIGIAASQSGGLGIIDADTEENTMTKNIRVALHAQMAVLSCMLAQKGFTGPVRVVEGQGGIRQTQGSTDIEHSVDFSGWRILQDRFKSMPLNTTTIGHVSATLALVKEHDLKPEDIEAVRIKASRRETRHVGKAVAKKYPRNAETADHSAFFANAIAIKERACTLEQFTPDKFTDPVILDLAERITVEADLDIPEWGRRVTSVIITKDGRRFQKTLEGPHGMGDDPLTDSEVEAKFIEIASKYVPRRQINRIFDTVWNIEKLDNISKLTALMVFPSR
ncbi:MAG: MmgE/PrpD family protein [Chloroflexi bacterium]|nr:MmgE/PrpD family protein [Chloroflexota bacterium]